MMTEEEIDGMGTDDLRAALRRTLLAEKRASDARSAEEGKKEKAMQMANSARLNIQGALAIHHLLRYAPHALAGNAQPNIHNLLTAAVADLDRADVIADCIPF